MHCIRKVLLTTFVITLLPGIGVGSALAASQSSTRQLVAVKSQAKNHRQQLHKSQTVINYWNNRGRWALFLKHEKCWDVKSPKGKRVCNMARRSLAEHTRLLKNAQGELVSAVSHYASIRMAATGHASSPLRREILGIVKASRDEGISPFFVLSIAGKESTLGENSCGKNAWGWNRCNGNGWRKFSEGARAVAHGLRTNYLGKWGSDTIAEVGNDYCYQCGNSWLSGVNYYMNNVFGAGSGMRWEDALNVVAPL